MWEMADYTHMWTRLTRRTLATDGPWRTLKNGRKKEGKNKWEDRKSKQVQLIDFHNKDNIYIQNGAVVITERMIVMGERHKQTDESKQDSLNK